MESVYTLFKQIESHLCAKTNNTFKLIDEYDISGCSDASENVYGDTA